MPDRDRFLLALTAAAVTAAGTAAVVYVLFAVLFKKRLAWAAAGRALGVGVGLLVGCFWLGVRPHWPPREDQDRFLFLLFPIAIVVEVLAIPLGRWIWFLRAAVAASAAWVLLYGSVYLEELTGPGSREWTPGQAQLNLALLAAALLAAWAALVTLTQRSGGRAVPLALAIVCGGSGLTIMLSGYASGGQLGLPLAAALVGVLLISLLPRGPTDVTGVTSLAVLGLFALLVIGRFFGELTTLHAVVLFLAPLLCWLPELPLVRRLNPYLRGLGRVALTVVPVLIVVSLAQEKFKVDSGPSATPSEEGSIDDYRNFGK